MLPSEADTASSSWDVDDQFEAYVNARQSALVRTAFLLTGELHSAEDLVQAALVKLYLSWGKVRQQGSIDAYVRRIMVNEHTTWWRRAWRRRETSVGQPPENEGVPASSDSDLEERDAMWRALQSLPPRQRAAVVLRYYEDLSEADTAELLNCSVGTVKSQTSRALATLRGALTEESEGES